MDCGPETAYRHEEVIATQRGGRMKQINTFLMTAILLAPAAWAAESPVEMEGTTVRGASELPKVLYIVPWKKSDLGDVSTQPGNDLFNEELVPLDRDIFRRQVMFYDQLQKDTVAETAPTTTKKK